MTIAEILSLERGNKRLLRLHREGMFLKAYEHSAFLIHNYVYPFKLSLKYVKTVHQDVISLGFPEKTLEKWLHGYTFTRSEDGMHLCCQSKHEVGEEEFDIWKATARVNDYTRFTPQTAAIEKTPLYKKCYDLMIEIFCVSKNISKHARQPLGDALKEKSYRLCFLVRGYYDSQDKESCVQQCRDLCKEVSFLMQALKDLREIPLAHFAMASELLVSVGKQLELLHRKVMANVSAE